MIGHHYVDRVIRPASRHMTGCAIRLSLRMLHDGSVAGDTLRSIVDNGFFVRIVARSASQPPGALLKACRLPQPVSLIHDLELVLVALARWMIEVHHVRAQRLAGPVRKRLAIEAADHSGQ